MRRLLFFFFAFFVSCQRGSLKNIPDDSNSTSLSNKTNVDSAKLPSELLDDSKIYFVTYSDSGIKNDYFFYKSLSDRITLDYLDTIRFYIRLYNQGRQADHALVEFIPDPGIVVIGNTRYYHDFPSQSAFEDSLDFFITDKDRVYFTNKIKVTIDTITLCNNEHSLTIHQPLNAK